MSSSGVTMTVVLFFAVIAYLLVVSWRDRRR